MFVSLYSWVAKHIAQMTGAPNGSVPPGCSFKYLFLWNLQLASKKKEQINSIFVNFLAIHEKCFDAYLLNL